MASCQRLNVAADVADGVAEVLKETGRTTLNDVSEMCGIHLAMPTAQERFETQDFPGRISGIRDVLAEFTQAHLDEIENFGNDGMARLEDLLDRTSLAVQSVDPELVSQSSIGRLMTTIQGIRAEADAFLSDQASSHLQRLLLELPDELGDALLSWLHALPTEDAVASVASDFRRVLEGQLTNLRERITEVTSELEGLNTALEASKSQVTSSLAEETTKIQTSIGEQQVRIDDLRQTIDDQRPRIDEAIQRFEAEFREGEKTREQQAKTLSDETESELSSLIGDTRKGAEEFTAEMAERLKQAQELVGVIAVTGSAASYDAWAKNQNRIANYWSWWTVGAGLVAGITLLLDYQNKVSGTRSIVHLVAGLVLFGVAGYAGQQSALHRKREGLARNMALKLTALPPFTDELSEEDKRDVKKQFAEKLFVGDDPQDSAEPSLTGSQISLVSQVLEMVKKWRN
jgi:hypothetical protein